MGLGAHPEELVFAFPLQIPPVRSSSLVGHLSGADDKAKQKHTAALLVYMLTVQQMHPKASKTQKQLRRMRLEANAILNL